MLYVNYNENGEVLGFYDGEIHENIPTGSVEISSEMWQQYLSNPDLYIIDLESEELKFIEKDIEYTPPVEQNLTIQQLTNKIKQLESNQRFQEEALMEIAALLEEGAQNG